jgi:hypothetical protein
MPRRPSQQLPRPADPRSSMEQERRRQAHLRQTGGARLRQGGGRGSHQAISQRERRRGCRRPRAYVRLSEGRYIRASPNPKSGHTPRT